MTISTILNETTLEQHLLSCLSPPYSTATEKIAKVCAFCLILLGSIFGNTFIIIIVYKHRDLRKTINYFIVNMAVSDLFFPLIVIPVQITAYMTGSWHWNIHGILGTIFCKLFFFLSKVSLVVSSQSLVWIAIDRFVAVVFPMKLELISEKIRAIAIISTWMFATVLNFPSLLNWGLVKNGNNTDCADTGSVFTNQGASGALFWLHWSFSFSFPLLLSAALYTVIAISLNRQNKALVETATNVQRNSLKKRRRAIQMSVVIVVMFYICVIPTTLYNFVVYSGTPSCAFLRLFVFLADFLLYTSSTVSPVICLSFVQSYRRGLRNILCPCDRMRNSKMAKLEQITSKRMNDRQTSKDPENHKESLETVL